MVEYYTIALVAFLGVLSPGPDFAIVVKNAISHHRTSGVYTSLGIGAGVLVHVSYCILGLAIVISQSVVIFSVIKYLGAGYLIYLGIKGFFAEDGSGDLLKKKFRHSNITRFRSFRDGFLTNVLNPKCTIFMLSLFTIIVKPNTPLWTQGIFGVELFLISVLWFSFLSYAITHSSIKSRLDKIQHIVVKAMGVVLVILGLSIGMYRP